MTDDSTYGGRAVLMWEARVAPGRLAEAIVWVRSVVLPLALGSGAVAAEGFHAAAPPSGDTDSGAVQPQPDRVVVLTRWPGPVSWRVPPPPEGVVERSHGWEFREIGEGSLR